MPRREPTLAAWGEDRLVARIRRIVGPPPPGTIGIGDDAAVLPPSAASTVLTTDVLAEGTHFAPGWFTAAELGHKALATSLSDVAAMGGRGAAALVSLLLPPETPIAAVLAFYRGMVRLGRRHGVTVVGGNLARGTVFSATVTLIGSLPGDRALLRRGAQEGDRLVVTGQPGLAGLGWALLATRKTPRGEALLPLTVPAWRGRLARSHPWAPRALARFLVPRPRIAEGSALRDLGARALMDVSDGLAADLPRFASAGGVAFVLDPSGVRLPKGFRDLAAELGQDPWEAFIRGGEDYELVAALSQRSLGRLDPGRAGPRLTVLGTVAEGRGVFVVEGSTLGPLALGGFDHFAGGSRITPSRRGRSRR